MHRPRELPVVTMHGPGGPSVAALHGPACRGTGYSADHLQRDTPTWPCQGLVARFHEVCSLHAPCTILFSLRVSWVCPRLGPLSAKSMNSSAWIVSTDFLDTPGNPSPACMYIFIIAEAKSLGWGLLFVNKLILYVVSHCSEVLHCIALVVKFSHACQQPCVWDLA